MPSEIQEYSIRTNLIQFGVWLIVFSVFVSAVQGHPSLLTLAGIVVGATIVAGVAFVTVTDR